jgi:hypothetical protein
MILTARHGAALVRQHNAVPPEVPPAFVADIPVVPCRAVPPHRQPYSITANGRHSRCMDGYCRLKLDLRSHYGFVAVKFLPSYWHGALSCRFALPYRAPRLGSGCIKREKTRNEDMNSPFRIFRFSRSILNYFLTSNH